VISAAIAAFLLTVPGSEPAKAVESRPSVSGSSPATPHTELSLAVVERLERLSKMSSEERAQALAICPPNGARASKRASNNWMPCLPSNGKRGLIGFADSMCYPRKRRKMFAR